MIQTKQFTRMTTTLGLKLGPVRKGVTPKRVLEFVLQDMTRIKADHGLGEDAEVLARCKGMYDAYRNVAHFIAPITDVNGER